MAELEAVRDQASVVALRACLTPCVEQEKRILSVRKAWEEEEERKRDQFRATVVQVWHGPCVKVSLGCSRAVHRSSNPSATGC